MLKSRFSQHYQRGKSMSQTSIFGVPVAALWRKPVTATSFAILLFAHSGVAQSLNFFKNYFVTGDYVVGGVGLRGLGDGSGFTKPTPITIPDKNSVGATGVPVGADIVGAFLYWQTVEKAQSASAGQQGFFNGHHIIGQTLGNPNAPVSWSSGGCAGASQGTTTLKTYRAD